MEIKDFKKSVATAARNIMRRQGIKYTDIEINHSLPFVNLAGYYYAQGEDAGNLIESITETSNKTGLALSTCLLWYLDSAGVFNNK